MKKIKKHFLHAPGENSPPGLHTLILLTGLSALSISIFLPSLPGMAVYFGVEYAVIQLSVGLYLMLNAPIQLVVGPLSDHYGRRPVLLASCLVFIVATTGCLLATNVYVFLFFRAMQAVIVSATVLTRAIVRDTTPLEKSAGRIAYIMMGMSMVPMVGPTLGGFLDEWFGWQAGFALLLAVGLLVTLLTWKDLGETALKSSPSIKKQFKDMPHLLKSGRFWGYALASSFASGAFFLFLSGGPLVGDLVFGLSPSQFGLYFIAMPMGYFVGNFFSTHLSERLGMARMIQMGLCTSISGLTAALLFTLSGLHQPIVFFVSVGFLGIGNGMLIPSATVGMLSVKANLVGSASGLGAALMTAGGALLSSLAGFLVYPGSGIAPLVLAMITTLSCSASLFFLVFRMEKNARNSQPSEKLTLAHQAK